MYTRGELLHTTSIELEKKVNDTMTTDDVAVIIDEILDHHLAYSSDILRLAICNTKFAEHWPKELEQGCPHGRPVDIIADNIREELRGALTCSIVEKLNSPDTIPENHEYTK